MHTALFAVLDFEQASIPLVCAYCEGTVKWVLLGNLDGTKTL
jgi:hypothetical protein